VGDWCPARYCSRWARPRWRRVRGLLLQSWCRGARTAKDQHAFRALGKAMGNACAPAGLAAPPDAGVLRASHDCMDAALAHLQHSPGARPGSHQEARRLLRLVPGARHLQVWRGARDHTAGVGAPGRLVNDPQGTRAADAPLALQQEGGCSRRSGQAAAARGAGKSTLTRGSIPEAKLAWSSERQRRSRRRR
jgi:hypothetical protein